MARLPQPGSDHGTWGDILNDYLSQTLKSDGSLKDNVVNATSITDGSITNSLIANGTITESKLHSAVQSKLNSGGGGGGDWDTLANKPAVIAAGADQTAARAAISATSSSDTPRVLLWDGDSWPARPADSRQTIFVGGNAPADEPTDVNTAAGDVWFPANPLTKEDVGLDNVDNTSDAAKNAATATLTNKRIVRRSVPVPSSATPSINTDTCDIAVITSLSTNITSMSSSLSGTPLDGQALTIRIHDDGTPRTIYWGAAFDAGGTTLPTTTESGKKIVATFVYDNSDSKWICESVADRDILVSPPTFQSLGTRLSGAGSSTVNVPVPADMEADDIAVVVIATDAIPGSYTVTPAAGFTEATSSPADSVITTRRINLHVFIKRAGGADAGTYNFSLSTSMYRVAWSARITGCVGVGSPLDTDNGGGIYSNNVNYPDLALTTSVPNTLLLWVATNWSDDPSTPPSGFSEIADLPGTSSELALCIATKTQLPAGATGSIVGSSAGSSSKAAWAGAFKP